MQRVLKAWLVVFFLLQLAACASELVLGTVYNELDNRSARNFKSYANFNDRQIAQIDRMASAYHAWHRKTQMPQYAALMNTIVDDISAADTLSLDAAAVWWSAASGFSDDLSACNPFNAASDLLKGLTDRQVRQITKRLRHDLDKHQDEYAEESNEERLQRRFKKITAWASRAGAKFNAQQKTLLRETLAEQVSLGKQRLELRRVWMENFIGLLNKRTEPDVETELTAHINTLWRLTSNNFPEQWRSNEELWTKFLQQFINLQTDEERQRFLKKIVDTAATFENLSQKKVSQKPICYR